jgi:adenosylmethionine-8-amino-7-oxononanoate aminotransferase
MTPKEKAKELVDKYQEHIIETDDYFINSGAKKCALIAVEEILNAALNVKMGEHEYWQEVKQEIKLL